MFLQYQNCTPQQAAAKILQDYTCMQPVDFNRLFRSLGIRAFAYDDVPHILKKNSLQALTAFAGVSGYFGDTPVIFFDGKRSKNAIRWILAHELGHIVLGHVRPHYMQQMSIAQSDSAERAADEFAAALLHINLSR
jgi:Zn-dependent peptidase ImmA (M78 family)